MTNHELIVRYFDSLNARDWAGFSALLDEHVVYEMPQTRERVRGREAYVDFNVTYPAAWKLEPVRIIADESRGSSEFKCFVENEVLVAIAFFEFNGEKIVRITDYWPEAYEPPARASRFVERV
jgi:ketosteroid isomerase-like protein